MKNILMAVAVVFTALSPWAAQRGESKVDSMVYDKGMSWNTFPSDKPVKAFALQKDVLWIANETGLHSMNMVKGSEKKDLAAMGSLAVTDVTALAVSSSGDLWVGTPNGCAVKMNNSEKIFTKDNGLPDNAVNVIMPVKGGKVWVGTDGGAAVFQSGSWTKYTTGEGLCGNKVRCVAADKNGTVWVGTDKGIGAFDGSSWKKYTMNDGMSWNDTKVIACDSRTNIVWAAVGEKDMNSFDGKAWKTYMDIADGIRSIMIDTHSRVWIGTSTGLVKFNGDEWVTDEENKIGIPAKQVSQMLRDDKGNLWFGMENGVMKVANPYPY
jgi:ligand-binding sensor domain-containing protein